MKAFLLSAGLGTRLRPLTDRVPKCLVEVGGRPLLDRWLDALAAVGVDEVVVNTHHLADAVEEHVRGRVSSAPLVHLRHEPVLLGSAGTLVANRDFVEGEEMFLVLNCDNLTDFDLGLLVRAHRAGGAAATLAVFRAPDPTQCGVLELDGDRVVGFEEKPARPRGELANAGMYAFGPEVLEEVPAGLPRDIGTDLLPRLVGRARAVPVGSSRFADIGTPLALARAREHWRDTEEESA